MSENNENTGFDQRQGEILVRLAKETIADHLGISVGSGKAVKNEQLQEPLFQKKQGVFVTLHKGGQLRGCIGSLSASVPIVEGIRDNAINAAFRDHRFSPLSREEFEQIDVEVSILSEPKRLGYNDPDDLLKLLRP